MLSETKQYKQKKQIHTKLGIRTHWNQWQRESYSISKESRQNSVCGTGIVLRNRDEHLEEGTQGHRAEAESNFMGESSWSETQEILVS